MVPGSGFLRYKIRIWLCVTHIGRYGARLEKNEMIYMSFLAACTCLTCDACLPRSSSDPSDSSLNESTGVTESDLDEYAEL